MRSSDPAYMYRPSLSRVLSFFIVLASLIGLSCAKEKGERQAATNAIPWVQSFSDGLAQARQSDRPMMIDFYTDWCGWCKKLDAETYVNGQVIAAAKDFVSVKVNADVDRETASRYKITGFPTILFTDAAGTEIHRVIGYRPAQNFLGEMNRALEAFKTRS